MIKLTLATCVIACAGCVSAIGVSKWDSYGDYVDQLHAIDADKAAGRTDGVTASATMKYWIGMKAAVQPVPIYPEVVAQDISKLPTQGVDPDLVRQGQIVVDKMRAAADSINSMPGVTILLRIPWSRWLEAEALSKAAVEQCYLVDQIRPELKARYGVEFPPLDVPKHGRE
jgi:hypothetical protein